MKTCKVKDLKKGDFFTLKPIDEPTENQVYVRDFYARDVKKYCAYKYGDCNYSRCFSGDKVVYIDFYF